jgi:large subunit ribosomal protein L32e
MIKKRKIPEFRRPLSRTIKRIKESWRRPRGLQSKVRQKEKSKLKMPDIGYRQPKKVRGLHPSGFKEVLVRNLKDLENVDPSKEAIRIAATVGKKKREEIIKKAKELKIKILNE